MDSRLATQVPNLNSVTAIAAGGSGFSLALKQDGSVWAWGYNSYGQVGAGSTTFQIDPIEVTKNVRAISAGQNHALALKEDGTVWAWGHNNNGQLGDGTTVSHSIPKQVANLSNVTSLAAGGSHSHALSKDGTVWSWGDGFVAGDGTWSNRLVPVQVVNLTGIVSIASGTWNTLAIKQDGSLWGWGANYDGQLGYLDSTENTRNAPVQLPNFANYSAISVGTSFNLALKPDGTVWAWGRNSYGQLADGSASSRSTPAPVDGMAGVKAVATGRDHSLALKVDGSVWAWGNNLMGQLGDGTATNRSAPVQVSGLANVIAIAAGEGYSIALKQDHSVWAWGYNYDGELGDGTTIYRNRPVEVVGNVSALAAGLRHVVALKRDDTAWAWGENYFGQIGDGTTTNRLSPVQVADNVATVAAGSGHTVAVKRDGSVWAWGNNTSGELGDGTTISRVTPASIGSYGDVQSICAGDSYTLLAKQGGTVMGWGFNYRGQLADGTTTSRSVAARLRGVNNVTSISCGTSHAAAIQASERLLSWGDNSNGQLGNGTIAMGVNPTLVVNAAGSNYLSIASSGSPLSTIEPGQQVPFFLVASGNIANTSASVATTTKFNPADQGKTGSVFITATVPTGALGTTAAAHIVPVASAVGEARPSRAAAIPPPSEFTLIQLTSTGWQTVVNGQLIPYTSGVLGDQLAAQTILNGTDTTSLKGAEFCVGYGTSAADMLANGNIRTVATIPGAITSTSCVVGGTLSVALSVLPGWNLLGNPVNQSIAVTTQFGDPAKVTSVWKWDSNAAKWQFYTPDMSTAALQSYASSKGYAVLSEIQAGDGFWVNAKAQADFGNLSGTAINLRQSSLADDWNLVSTASTITAKDFNLSLSTTPPTTGQVPINMTSLWAWDTATSRWYFYAPTLDAQGGSALTSYINSQNYVGFGNSAKTLGNGVGFWVKRP
jgi:alpha-tubulin suppressor-like RCC1 family protein